MSLFHVTSDGLIQFRPVNPAADNLADTLTTVLWRDLDAVTGERLLPVHSGSFAGSHGERGVGPAASGILVALDVQGNIVLICVRRVFDHAALTDCLEALGWARGATVSELAELYWQGMGEFWRAWQQFAGSAAPPSVSRKPRLVIAATDVSAPSESTLDFLMDHDLPVAVLRMQLFVDHEGQHVLEVHGAPEREFAELPSEPSSIHETPSHVTPVERAPVERASEKRDGVPDDLVAQAFATTAPRRVDPLSDTLTRLAQEPPKRLTGNPAVEQQQLQQPAVRPRPTIRRAPDPVGVNGNAHA